MKKICFVNPSYIKKNTGGAEVQIFLLAREFLKSGWQVFYLTEDVSEKEVDNGINLIPFNYNENDCIQDVYSSMSRILRDIDADVYYQRGRKKYTYLLQRFSSEYNKLFIFASSMDLDCKMLKESFRNITIMTLPKKILTFPKNFQLDIQTLRAIKKSNLVLSQTNNQKVWFKKNLNIDSIVFPNVHEIPETKIKKNSEPPIILWLANIKEWKQPEIFLALVEHLHQMDCKFIMAGKIIDEKYRIGIVNTEKKYSNFHYIEEVPFEKSNELIQSASIFINTSKLNEGFPNTFIQAWMRCTPVISLNHDPDDLIKKEKIGFHSKSFHQLIIDTKILITNPELRIIMGKKARDYSISQFSINQCNVLIKIFDELRENGTGIGPSCDHSD